MNEEDKLINTDNVFMSDFNELNNCIPNSPEYNILMDTLKKKYYYKNEMIFEDLFNKWKAMQEQVQENKKPIELPVDNLKGFVEGLGPKFGR